MKTKIISIALAVATRLWKLAVATRLWKLAVATRH